MTKKNKNQDDIRDDVIEFIEIAFKGVDRKGGISFSEAIVIDNYGPKDKQLEARKFDQDRHWKDIKAEDIERGSSVLCFLNPIGFRYYIPAYMVWTLENYRVSSSATINNTIYALDFFSENKALNVNEYVKARCSLLNEKQCKAVALFLQFMSNEPDVDDLIAKKCLDRYWGQFLAEADRLVQDG